VGYGRTRHPLHNRKGAGRKLSAYGCARCISTRQRVIRIFPNEASACRLLGALLAEHHEVWSTGKRYFDMAEYFEWKTTQTQEVIQEMRHVS
jgi:Transposase, Mutator family